MVAALLAPGALFAQTSSTTIPVGYTTVALAPDKFTLLSITTQQPTVASGVLTAESASDVTTTGVDFTTLLTTGVTYILELPDGVIQEVTSWTATTLNTPQDVTASVVPNTTTYKLRRADTVASIFGAANSAGLTADDDEDPYNNDLVLVPNASNAFDTVYYFTGEGAEGWYTVAGDPANDLVLNYSKGLFVQRGAGSTINLVLDGEVKITPTSGSLVAGYNFLGSVAPVGLTLGTSTLNTFLTFATNETEANDIADNVLWQKPDGSYRTAYYFNDGETVGWFDTVGDPAEDLPLDTGFLIFNKGVAKPYAVNLPSSYSSL